ncbi:hypothetical protein [Enterococcus wangshanyuanii]
MFVKLLGWIITLSSIIFFTVRSKKTNKS